MPNNVKGGRLDLMTALIMFQQNRNKSFSIFDRSKALHLCNWQIIKQTM